MSELREQLVELDVPAAVLRRDPRGHTWLGASADDPAARPEIARFVEGERALFDEADVGADPLFTARVLAALPERPVGAGLSTRGRLVALAGGYLAAAVFGWFALDAESTTVTGVATTAHGIVAQLDGVSPSFVAAVLVPVALLVIALFARTTHTETA
jgi:hypothetical protein